MATETQITQRFGRFLKTAWTASTVVTLLILFGIQAEAQNPPPGKPHYETPRLVVGIMVDQMRYDFIYRYWDKYGDDGIKRLLNEGFSFDNTHFDYMPTSTGPGHAGVYGGTTPSVHGVLGNSWYVRELGRSINVVEDLEVEGVGAEGSVGNRSPRNMLTTTVGDELRLHTNNRSRVIGISFKDRGAILPAGHTGKAYWFDHSQGHFVTSTWYHDELPQWVREFNERDLVEKFLSKPWETLLPIEEYVESIADDNPYETPFPEHERPVFPHDLPALLKSQGPGVIQSTPFGDELLLELALAAIEGESLGRGPAPDMLAISFSSPDTIGHRFGPASVEIQDTYLRFDRQIARLLGYLDQEFGKENILLFLTADHGVTHVPDYLADQGIPAGHFDASAATDALRAHLVKTYGEDLLLSLSNFQVFLDRDRVRERNLALGEVQMEVARFMLSLDGVAGALTAESLAFGEFSEGLRRRVQQGFNQKRSGDVAVWLKAQWTPGTGRTGTTHGSPHNYDTRAPLVFYGWDIPAGRSTYPAFISDIAPTVAIILNAPFPSGTNGNPLNHLMRPR